MTNSTDIPPSIRRGWRESMRNGSWFRRCGGWGAIVTADVAGYRVVLRRTWRTFDDALAATNEILERA